MAAASDTLRDGTNCTHATEDQNHKTFDHACKAYLAMLMLDETNRTKFYGLEGELDINYTKGSDTYPTNRNTMLFLLNCQKDSGPTKQARK